MKPVLAILAMACAVARGQSFEASLSGGVSRLTGSAIGPDTFSQNAAPGSSVRLNNGFRLAFRLGLNTWRFFGSEFGYAYNRTALHFDGPPVTEAGMAIHQGFLNVLAYGTPERLRVRPFLTGGVHFSNFVPPGSSAQRGQGENKFGVNYGGGLKVRVTPNWQLRFDVRQYEQGKPFHLQGARGRLLLNEVSAGVGFVL